MTLEIVILISTLLGILGAVRLFPKQRTGHGSAGWGRPTPLFFGVEPASLFLGKDKGKSVYLPAELTLQHTLILGGSGTGKSRGFFMPNAAVPRAASLVTTDPKGELWEYTSGFHANALRFAPTEPDRSEGFNWVPLCTDPRLCQLAARAIAESGNTGTTEQAWIDMDTAFLSSLFAHAATTIAPTPLTAYRLFTRLPQSKLMDILLESPSPLARAQANIFLQTHEKLRGSIVPVMAARLQFLEDEKVARFCSSTLAAPDFGKLRENPAAIYWCLQEQDVVRLRPLTSVFFTLLLEQIAQPIVGSAQPIEGNGLPITRNCLPILLFLDEFANIGKIPGFSTTLSLARGRGLSLVLGIQSLAQLEENYGKATAQTILSNCATKICLHGADVTTGKYVSESLGEMTAVSYRRSWRAFFGIVPAMHPSVMDQENRRFLLTADEVRRIPSNRAIVICSNHRPWLLEKTYYNARPYIASIPTPLPKAQTVLITGSFKRIPPLTYKEDMVIP
jgi:type IV secretion system protein VirD4